MKFFSVIVLFACVFAVAQAAPGWEDWKASAISAFQENQKKLNAAVQEGLAKLKDSQAEAAKLFNEAKEKFGVEAKKVGEQFNEFKTSAQASASQFVNQLKSKFEETIKTFQAGAGVEAEQFIGQVRAKFEESLAKLKKSFAKDEAAIEHIAQAQAEAKIDPVVESTVNNMIQEAVVAVVQTAAAEAAKEV